MRRLFRQFSTPGGVPSHVSVPTPGSIHEGGELGYVLAHAFGAAFDNPDLIVVAVVGDGEAETGPLDGSWKGIRFLNPARDGAVLPILHLNGYKIAGPTVLGRSERRRGDELARGHGYEPSLRRGRRPRGHAPALRRRARHVLRGDPRDPGRGPRARGRDAGHRAGRRSSCARRRAGPVPRWSMACRSRAPSARTRCRSPTCSDNPEHLALLEAWMRSYRPETLFDDNGRLVPELAALAPGATAAWAPTRTPTAGASSWTSTCPTSRTTPSPFPHPATERHESTRALGELLRDIFTRNAAPGELPAVLSRTRPTPTASATCSRSRTAARRAGSSRTTTTSRPTAG